VPSITQAYYNSLSLRYRVRFSPYAFNYHNNGLVPGGIKYSSHAFDPGSSGLVFEGVRYIPYAFNNKSTGLVLDYYYYPIPYIVSSPLCSSNRVYGRYAGVPPDGAHDASHRPRFYDHNRDTVAPATANGTAASTEDAMAIIRQYLRERRLSDVGINRILRISDKLVSADFTIGGRNLLIKYWDPAQLQSPATKADPQRSSTSPIESRSIEKYTKDWEIFAGKYQQEGGEIYVVAASSRAEIIAALDACEKLRPGDTEPGQPLRYVKQ
jgi:hypothetical protein